jgi:hypothetical protein
MGEVEVGGTEGCSFMEIEVDGLSPEATYDVFVLGEGGAALVTTFMTNAEGSGHGAIESCSGDRPLPFGVASVADLAGLEIIVKDAAGGIVLLGTVPEMGSEEHGDDVKEDDGEEDDEKEGDGDDGKTDDEHEGETEKV